MGCACRLWGYHDEDNSEFYIRTNVTGLEYAFSALRKLWLPLAPKNQQRLGAVAEIAGDPEAKQSQLMYIREMRKITDHSAARSMVRVTSMVCALCVRVTGL